MAGIEVPHSLLAHNLLWLKILSSLSHLHLSFCLGRQEEVWGGLLRGDYLIFYVLSFYYLIELFSELLTSELYSVM